MYHAIVFLPLAGFLIAGLFGRIMGARASEIVTTSLLFVAAALSWVTFFQVAWGTGPVQVTVVNWMTSGGLSVDWALKIDTLTAVMLVVVNSVSALVHLYSIGYMHEDPSRPRFFAYLSLFTFAMLMLVTADNLVQMFFGWEGVGLASYLLIGFWYHKDSANAAAMKAFVVNRVGDFGFLLGIFTVFVMTGSVAFADIFAKAPEMAQQSFRLLGHEWNAMTLACLLLFMGAMGKSAQFLLHTWLPDAMEGPTPVSALIHAATMVTAGVFMVARLSPLFELAPTAMVVMTVIGATTAFFAATVGLVQNDIKRVIAYSTCSQLGYMFVALGVGAFGAGVFHLFTHAFFKALLFLGAGSVIHACHHEQDMRKMGGLARYIPFTMAAMLIGNLALTGFPFTAGYYSKDAIIEASFASHSPASTYAFLCVVVAALFTSFYSWRLFFMTFFGEAKWKHAAAHDHDAHAHDGHGHGDHTPHESPAVMMIPLAVLSVGALAAGAVFAGDFIGASYDAFWKGALFTAKDNHILHDMHNVPGWVKLSPMVMMVLGFVVAWWFYVKNPEAPRRLAADQPLMYRFLLNKWYFDEIYDFLFVRPAKWLGSFLWKKGDGWLIDGFGPDGVSARVVDVANRAVRLQSGYLYHYAFAMLIGVALFVTWYLVGGAH
ncbi:NADH-quinone oxidoreductase subunit L [Camelimonas abortus]|uniref:NADH-quinone oxidoreductase subunit L n=1 Tax=Camelimonas abortus TaxID=1017184 RepID=A0ABV7LFI2_9HYPH